MPYALLVDDDQAGVQALEELVKEEGFETSTASTLEEAERQILTRAPDLALLDLVLPDGSSLDLIARVVQSVRSKVIMMTGHADVETAVAALKLGAHDYFTKPLDPVRLRSVLQSVIEDCRAQEQLLAGGDGTDNLIGASPAMAEIRTIVDRVAQTDATVLLTGETGTGKEIVAARIHALSARRQKPIIAVNCAALTANLLESELFGHERGSFTGASRTHIGFFERADKGTIFLDEITEMQQELQAKLLRVLETGAFLRVGGQTEIKTDVRVIAATNRQPEEAVHEGKLRQDLLYRLSVFPIVLPPLRERGDDVILLAERFLSVLNAIESTNKRLLEPSRAALKAQPWPGNVRELQNLIRRAFIMADKDIGPEHFVAPVPLAQVPVPVPVPVEATAGEVVPTTDNGAELRIPYGAKLADTEKQIILATLRHCGGHRRHTAEMLGISPKTLYNRLVAYNQVDAYNQTDAYNQADA